MPPEVDGAGQGMHLAAMSAVVNYKIGNEKLVKVLEGASSHLRGLLDRQGRPDGALRIAVSAYMVVISAMLATALATGNVVAGLGAALFVASDSMIAWDRFVRPWTWAPLAIMVTYHLGQAGLVASLLR